MKLAHCVNLEELKKFWGETQPQDNPRWNDWLHHNVYNYIVNQLDEHLAEFAASKVFTGLRDHLGLSFKPGVLPREMLLLGNTSLRSVGLIDPYKLKESERAHHNMGGQLFVLDTSNLDEHVSKIDHLREALTAEAGHRTSWSRITVAQATTIAEEWVQRLNARKLESGGTVREVWRAKFAEPPPSIYTIPVDGLDPTKAKLRVRDVHAVQLIDEWAFKAEGKTMSHCVASYYFKDCAEKSFSEKSIVSIRYSDTGERLATLEITGGNISQAKAYKNAPPSSQAANIISKFASDTGLTDTTKSQTSIFRDLSGLGGVTGAAYPFVSGGGGGASLHVDMRPHTAQFSRTPEYVRITSVNASQHDPEIFEVTLTGLMTHEQLRRLRG